MNSISSRIQSAAYRGKPQPIRSVGDSERLPQGAKGVFMSGRFYKSVLLTGAALLGASLIGVRPASADVTGFGGSGTGWTFVGNGSPPPTVTNNDLTLTTVAIQGDANAAWYNTQQNVAKSWTASFTWQLSGQSSPNFGPGDGFLFVVQSEGTNAVSGSGGFKGYAAYNTNPGITPSAAIGIENYPGAYGVQFGNDGTLSYISVGGGGTGGSTFLSSDTNPINFTVAYNSSAQTLSITGTDPLISADTFTQTKYAVNIGTIVGGTTGYIGFTGGTGGASETQNLTNFAYSTVVPEPASLAVFAVGGVGLLLIGRKRRMQRSA